MVAALFGVQNLLFPWEKYAFCFLLIFEMFSEPSLFYYFPGDLPLILWE